MLNISQIFSPINIHLIGYYHQPYTLYQCWLNHLFCLFLLFCNWFLDVFLYCGTFCFYIVVLFVSTLWYFLFLHCVSFCFNIVVLFVSTLWYFLFLHCGTFCVYIVVHFVSTLWYLCRNKKYHNVETKRTTMSKQKVPQCWNKTYHNVETKSTTM
jgi:hypothetical protein